MMPSISQRLLKQSKMVHRRNLLLKEGSRFLVKAYDTFQISSVPSDFLALYDGNAIKVNT